MRGDRVAGIGFLVLALAYTWGAWKLEPGFVSDPVGPKAFPLGVALLLGGTALRLVLRPDPGSAWPSRLFWYRAILLAASLVLYAYVIRAAGFVLLTTLEVALLSRLSGSPWPQGLALGGGLSVALWWLFSALGVSLPGGTLWEAMPWIP